jgi:hypothetical protein
MTFRYFRMGKIVSEEPISVPGSPFWTVFKRFGRDELIAMIVNVSGTAIASIFNPSTIVLSVIGPVIEKIGFFPAHIKEALGVYKTTPKEKRKRLSQYIGRAFKGGLVSLLEDLLIHDPVYILLMIFGLNIYAGTPVWLLSAASFIIAVFIVAALEVLVNETRYKLFKKRYKKKRFHLESYYESRFFIKSTEKADAVLKKIAKRFGLAIQKEIDYHDCYLENKLPDFSGREGKIRLRRRKRFEGNYIFSAQIIYTRAGKEETTKVDQYRFFPIKKEKLYYIMQGTMPKKFVELKDKHVKKTLQKITNKEMNCIKFKRRVAHNPELLVSVDNLHDGKYLLEIKTYKNKTLLIEAMRYVMEEFPLVQTTKGKHEL